MSKGLEALWEYRLLVANYEDRWIKTTTEHFIKCADVIEQELKALEIIKEKDVSMYWLRHSKSANDYNKFILTAKRQYQKLTQEEYDVLKEVLL